MRETLAIILTVYVSLVLCQELTNRQDSIDGFIQQLAQQNATLRPVRPFQNPGTDQFSNGQNQGSTFGQQQPPSPAPSPSSWPPPQQNTGQTSLEYPSIGTQSPSRPVHKANVSACTYQMVLF